MRSLLFLIATVVTYLAGAVLGQASPSAAGQTSADQAAAPLADGNSDRTGPASRINLAGSGAYAYAEAQAAAIAQALGGPAAHCFLEFFSHTKSAKTIMRSILFLVATAVTYLSGAVLGQASPSAADQTAADQAAAPLTDGNSGRTGLASRINLAGNAAYGYSRVLGSAAAQVLGGLRFARGGSSS
ncbi:hypothetical protein BCR43DRAFT_518978 [Syncephalastrum racemosum]|uniref:Uncharacterized protein n=1 Tax=Syncephalastrum racemosum TaxID=13706 RepID=A0A1X2H0C4_SYNRA|nr:hypothetical protein BCR43DRAFT_518978 [Syncephalastrum racemosum]